MPGMQLVQAGSILKICVGIDSVGKQGLYEYVNV